MPNIPYGGEGVPSGVDTQEFSYVELLAGHIPEMGVYPGFKGSGSVAIPAFSVVGVVGGFLTLATKGAAIADAEAATATITFAANAAAGDTVTIGATTYTFVAALTGAANQVLIGATASATLDNLVAAINQVDGAGVTYDAAVVENASAVARKNTDAIVGLVARVPGIAGNAITLSEVGINSSVTAFSGGLEAGGVQPLGFTVAPIAASGVEQSLGLVRAGNFNIDALNWHASFDTDAEKLAAFEGAPSPTNIVLQKIA